MPKAEIGSDAVEPQYFANLTGEPFLYFELKQVAKLTLTGLSPVEIRAKITDENLFQSATNKSIDKLLSATLKRVAVLDAPLLNILVHGSLHTSDLPQIEDEQGSMYLAEALRDIASPEVYVELMADQVKGSDIVFLTGVGKVWPMVRSHNILNNLHHVLDKVPVIMFFPGNYNGSELRLFNKLKDDNYYRAFRLIEK